MSQQSESFLAKLEKVDPEFYKAFQSIRYGVSTPGALDPKTRILVSLAIHVALGGGQIAQGANRARALGVSDDEIKEIIRMVFLLRGVPSLITGLAAF